jgi:hypothetical protein
MKLSHFVSGSSLVLAGWLAATFFHETPAQRYLKPEKNTAGRQAPEIPMAQVSVSP